MRFAIDANETPVAAETWSTIFKGHDFIHVTQLGMEQLSDIDLYSALVTESFDALITRDRRQLIHPDEKKALLDSGLTWIGHAEPNGSGLTVLANLVSSYCVALPHILSAMESTSEPLKFVVKGRPNSAGQVLNAWHLQTGEKYSFPR